MVRAMFDRIASRYDLVNRVMTFGMDRGWRRRALDELRLHPGSLVIDLACGTGDFCRELIVRGHHPVGVDFALEMLRAARTDAPLVQADVLRLPFRAGVADAVTCGFALRNVIDLSALFDESARVLRPGGRCAFLDVSAPRSAVLRAVHAVYFRRIVPFVGGLLSDKDAYRYLPASTAYLPPTERLQEILQEVGFEEVEARTLGAGAVQLLTATR